MVLDRVLYKKDQLTYGDFSYQLGLRADYSSFSDREGPEVGKHGLKREYDPLTGLIHSPRARCIGLETHSVTFFLYGTDHAHTVILNKAHLAFPV